MTAPGAADGPPTYALVGWPLSGSLSPVIHAAAFAAVGLDARYVLCPTPPGELEAVVEAIGRGRLAGANVTVPYKVEVRALVDDESPLVAAVGAANTLVRDAAGLVRAENTDVLGFRAALEALGLLDGRGRRALVLGAGGAARAAGHALLAAGFGVRVLSRDASQGAVVVATLYRAWPGSVLANGPLSADELVRRAGEADLVVNATPVGGPPDADASPWPAGAAYPASAALADLVAWPTETRWVALAREAGARAVGGLPMLVGQAAASFELWTGRAAPIEAMRRAAEQAAEEAQDAATLPDRR